MQSFYGLHKDSLSAKAILFAFLAHVLPFSEHRYLLPERFAESCEKDCRHEESGDMLEKGIRTLMVRRMTRLIERNASGVVTIGFIRH